MESLFSIGNSRKGKSLPSRQNRLSLSLAMLRCWCGKLFPSFFNVLARLWFTSHWWLPTTKKIIFDCCQHGNVVGHVIVTAAIELSVCCSVSVSGSSIVLTFGKKRERRRKPSEITTGVQVWRRCSVRQCCCWCSLQLFSFSPLDDYTLWSGRDRGGSSSSNRTMAICHSTTLHFLNGKSTWATASFETYAAAAAAVSGIFFFFYFFDWSTSSPSAAAAAAHSATLRRQSIIIDSMTPIRVDAPLEKEEEEMPDRQGPSFHNSDKVCVLLGRADCLY